MLTDGDCEFPQVTADLSDLTLGEHLNTGMQGHRGHQGVNQGQGAFSPGEGVMQPVGHAPQDGLPFHQGHGKADIGNVQRGLQSCRPPADDQGVPGQGHGAIL